MNTGDVGAAFAGAAKTVTASYFTAYQMHGALGPNCSVADVTPNGDDALLCLAGPVPPDPACGRGGARRCRRPRSASRSSRARAPTATAPTTTSASPRRSCRRWSASRSGCSSCAGTSTAGISSARPRRPTSAPGSTRPGTSSRYDYTAYNHGWTQVVESAAELAGTPLPARSGRAGRHDRLRRRSTRSSNRRVTSKVVNGYAGFLKGIWLRAPGAPQATFASEQTIDALAHAANMDPIAFRHPEHRRDPDERRRPLGRRPQRGREGRRTGSRRCRPRT